MAADAKFAVAVLTAMNLLNYFDRYVPSAVKDLFKTDLGLTDAETSWPLTAFVVVYMITSPIFGSLADRVPRRVLIAGGVALWSLATGGAALATGFWTFLLARALVGVGEAAYATLAPPLISDYFPPERRNRVLTLFYVAIPVGAALGFAIGGWLGKLWGWRVAFLACGLPGVLAALLALKIRDPGKQPAAGDPPPPGWPEAARTLLANRSFVFAVAGYTLVTFASGGMADWLPTWLARARGMDLAAAGSAVGTVTVVGGLGGTLAGGWLADRLAGRTKNHYLALSALSMGPAAVLAGVALLLPGAGMAVACVGVAQFFMWFYNGPINTVIANSVPAEMRARAFSLSILCIHLFGDAISPPIIGQISDVTGDLTLAVAIVPVMLAAGAATWALGWRRL
ncbi:MAG: spinster family MFS transporter [Myxococcota bacterium]